VNRRARKGRQVYQRSTDHGEIPIRLISGGISVTLDLQVLKSQSLARSGRMSEERSSVPLPEGISI